MLFRFGDHQVDNFEQLTFDGTAVSSTVSDDYKNDEVTVKLTVDKTALEEGGKVVYTATLYGPDGEVVTNEGGAITVTLDNGQTVTIAKDASAGTVEVAVREDELIVQGDVAETAAITAVAQAGGDHQVGNFEQLTFDGTAVSSLVSDDYKNDEVTVKLAVDKTALEEGGKVVYTATLYGRSEEHTSELQSPT